jgi:hypothetical protein
VAEEALQAIVDSGREVAVVERVRDVAKRYWSL